MLLDISYPPIPAWEVGPLTVSLQGVFAGIGIAVGIGLLL